MLHRSRGSIPNGAALVDVAVLRFHGIVQNVERDRAKDVNHEAAR
jgi:hypothetical protein